jgi:hypothetical protein
MIGSQDLGQKLLNTLTVYPWDHPAFEEFTQTLAMFQAIFLWLVVQFHHLEK